MQQGGSEVPALNGALLINKPAGITSFGVIETLQKQFRARYGVKRSQLPKMGHGGTLDPFATGLMIVCVGKAVKLARYFLGSEKHYEGVIRFGETTIPGDPTEAISETSPNIPPSREVVREMAHKMTLQPYLQIPPMHSAKKKDGKPLYELARAGLEVEREPKLCELREFEIMEYTAPRARFCVRCSSGTYIRVVAQDLARLLGTVGMLDSLHRTGSGAFRIQDSCTLEELTSSDSPWDEASCWIPFDRMLEGFPRALATREEVTDIVHGKQQVLFNLLRRAEGLSEGSSHFVIYEGNRLLAIAGREENIWSLERVFP